MLVLDANLRSALAIVRSLGRAGADICTADELAPALASASRYSRQAFVYPSAAEEPEEFLQVLEKKVRDLGIELLIPVSEVSIYIVLKNRQRFSGVTIPYPDYDLFQEVSNKSALFRTADKLGLAIPGTVYADKIQDLEQLDPGMPYPVIVKPCRSRVEDGGRWRDTSVHMARDYQELVGIFTKNPLLQRIPVMFQQYIEGHGQGVFAYCRPGADPVFFAHRRIREKPPSGGVSVLSESIAVPPELRRSAEILLRHYNWHGIAMVEYRVDPEGKAWLMEINARFWGSLQLAISSGCDFPLIMYQDVLEGRSPESVGYRVGTRCRWLLGDLDHLLLVLRPGKGSRNRHYTFWQKLQAVVRFVLPAGRRVRHEVDRLDDPGPFLVEIRQYVAALFGRRYGRRYVREQGKE